MDSVDTEQNIRRMFSKTLLGPAQFCSKGKAGKQYEEEGDSGGQKVCVRAHVRRRGCVWSRLTVLGLSPSFNQSGQVCERFGGGLSQEVSYCASGTVGSPLRLLELAPQQWKCKEACTTKTRQWGGVLL